MIKWIRPSGLPIELADTENLNEFAKAQGWKKDEPEEPKPKRKRRTPAEMAAARKEALEDGSDSGSNN